MRQTEIEQDLEKAGKAVDYFLCYGNRNQNKNYRITKENYLYPMFEMDEVMPMNHASGLFMYFRKLHETLSLALLIGYIEEKDLPEGAPGYLEELVKY